jgi:monovalent cation:H+ antiporter-2, CPA2 family
MHSYDLILTLTAGLGAALVLGYVTHRLGLSPIVGYLLAGTIVGPYTYGYVADASMAEQLAEIGVILLMFGVGLQFHIDELLAVRRVAVPGAIAQSAVATVLGALLAVAIGWSWSAGLVFGMALAVASTVVLVRVLADQNDLHTQAGHIAVGWLVVEDLFTVVALVLMPAIARAFHADGPRDCPGHRRRLVARVQRLDGARRVSRGDGGGPIRLQPARGIGSAADA